MAVIISKIADATPMRQSRKDGPTGCLVTIRDMIIFGIQLGSKPTHRNHPPWQPQVLNGEKEWFRSRCFAHVTASSSP